MGTGKRFNSGRGGGGGRRRLTEELRRLIKLNRNDHSSVDDIVQRIRRYQNYSRMPLNKLSTDVARILQEEEDTLESSRTHPRKKMKISDDHKLHTTSSPKKLQLDGLESDSGSDSGSESRPSSSSVDEEDEPKFDLMKSMLRETYSAKLKQAENEKEKNIELEVSTPKRKMVSGGSKGEDSSRAARSGGGEGAVEEGPRFKDFGGMEEVLKELELEVFVPLFHPHVPRKLGVNPISGILLHGPPGCGKTKLAHAIANETSVPFYKISATEIVSGVSGASEENIRELFSKAYRTAPSIVFIDEIDAIASKRENLQREMERRIVTQLMTCMDDFHKLAHPSDSNSNSEAQSSEKTSGYVLVIGATNRPDALDPALRRPGRFDREIRLGVPNENARVEILSVLTKKCTLEGSLDLLQIARATPGFVGADLYALVDKAGNLAMRRVLDQRKFEISMENNGKDRSEEWWKIPWSAEEIEKLSITMADFEKAAKLVQPSLRREGFSTIPNVKWDDVGGLQSVRNEFEICIVKRVKSPESYQKFGLDLETGILLYGPPGCGKTLIAKAVANEAGANFIHVKGPELLNKYVGESEMSVRTLFGRARMCSPCVLFFDEVDAITTKRGNEGAWVVERLLTQLLIELDGADQRQGVFVIGATNIPNVMDPAILRPGRFGKRLYVPLPSSDDRGLILKAHAKGKPIDPSVDLLAVGRTCENFSGADLKNLMNEAAMAALVEASENSSQEETSVTINENHFQRALIKITPSVSEEQIQDYEIWAKHFKAT